MNPPITAYAFKSTIIFYISLSLLLLVCLYIRFRLKYTGGLPVFKWIGAFYFERLTVSGRLLFWTAILSSILGMSTTAMKTYMVFTLIMSIFIISYFFSWFFRPKLSMKCDLPDKTTCGQKLYYHVSVKSQSKICCYDLVFRQDSLPEEIKPVDKEGYYLTSLKPGEDISFKMGLEFLKRGDYKVGGIKGETVFPFGLWTCGRHLSKTHHFLVYPRFHHLDNVDIPIGKRYQPGGIALTSSLGESTEFIGNREFRDGDNPRNIHWRSWARTGKPVVKEFQEEYFCRIALLLDTFVPPGSSKEALDAFEAAISISASIADYLSRQEYIIDIFAAGDNIYYMQAGRSLGYLENILDLLACIDVCPVPPFEKLEPILMDNLSNITTVVTVFLDWDERREKLVRMITELGTSVKVVIVKNGPPSTDPVSYEELVGKIITLSPEEEKKGVMEI